jgi:amino acid adenylation domain-containing protein
VQFAQWQRDLLESGETDSAEGREYWKKSKASAPPIPVLPQEIAGVGTHPETVSAMVGPDLLQRLQNVADANEASLSDVLLTAWTSLIWRLTGQSQFLVSVFSDGREYQELQTATGLIGKNLPIPAQFAGEPRFIDVLRQVRLAQRQATGWQEFYAPEESSEPSFGYDFTELPAQPRSGLALRVMHEESCTERFKLKLSVVKSSDSVTLTFQFDPARVAHASLQRWSEYLLSALAGAATAPSTPVGRLPLLKEQERELILTTWNRTSTEYPREVCIHELFEAQAAQYPNRPAVRCDEDSLTYQALNENANRLAHHLRGLGVGPDSLVGLCVDRSCETITALLSILKAGGAYVPLSADHPKPRLAQQLAGCAVLITESKFLPKLPDFAGSVVCIDQERESLVVQPITNPKPVTNPESLVYVIFTSGSTGVPKGVSVRHRNLVNYASSIQRRLELERYPDGLNFATVTALNADLGNTCIYAALLSGGCLHVIKHETAADSQRMREYTAKHPVDVLKIVPSHLAALLDGGGNGVLPRRILVTGGETLTRHLVEKVVACGADCEIVNHYGPTETTVGSLTLRLKDYDWRDCGSENIPLGRPIANTRLYILDARLEPVPVGVTGELFIAGNGVAAGYLNQPELTAQRFLPDTFSGEMNAVMYRTGDLARYLPDGNVEFLGRADDQVKIRGFRIELGEIQSAVERYPNVKEAIVLARADESGEKRLVAYVVARAGTIDVDRLRGHLREELPDYMVPSAVVTLNRLPLTDNGKIDRQALSAYEVLAAAKPYVAPRTPTEITVAEIWQEVLHRGQVGVDDDFFEIGGHSLVATQIASRLREHLSISVGVRLLFDNTTVGALAAAIDSIQEDSDDESDMEIVPVSRRI